MTNRCEKCKRQFATDDDQDVFCSSCLDGQAGSRGPVNSFQNFIHTKWGMKNQKIIEKRKKMKVKQEIITIPIWAEHTRMKGHLCTNQELIDSGSDDLVIYKGTAKDLALVSVFKRAESTSYAWRTAVTIQNELTSGIV